MADALAAGAARTLPEVPSRIETACLVIRAPRAGDGEVVYESVRQSLAHLRAWPASLPWALAEPSVARSEQFCRRGAASWQSRSDFPMLLFLKGGNRHVGCTGLHRVDWTVPTMEVGYWCHREFQGQGLVSEAVRAVVGLACGRLGVRRLTCLTEVENLPSRRVAERAGFVLEQVMRHERVTPGGELRDTCLYAIAR